MLSVGECPVQLDTKVSSVTHPTHVSLPCCSNERLLRLSYPHSALAATASGIGLRCSYPGLGCFQSSSIPGGLLG